MDTVRVIGTFNKANQFHLNMDDNQPENQEDLKKYSESNANLIIVEPHILIPTTQIVKAFPCTRKAFLSN
jgi:hypothetical protein